MRTSASRSLGPAAIGTLLLLSVAFTARAEEPQTKEERPRRITREILLSPEEAKPDSRWFPSFLNLDGDAGLSYTRPFRFRERGMVFSVEGPAL